MRRKAHRLFYLSEMERVCTVEQIRSLEQESFRQLASRAVMQRAGEAVAAACSADGPVLAAAGPGNNGGDAIVAAAALAERGIEVQVWLPLGDSRPGSDAADALAGYRSAGGKERSAGDLPPDAPYGLIIDGLFGIGLARGLDGPAAAVADQANHHPAPVVAVDVPSGLDADSGAACSAAVAAGRTVTFFASKPGLHMRAGPSLAGEVEIDALGFAELTAGAGGELIESADACAALQRSSDTHKGSFGTLAAVGGAPGMTGALALATRAAVAHGAGKVYALAAGDAPAYDPAAPEVMWPAGGAADGKADLPAGTSALLVGCGLGRGAQAGVLLEQALEERVPAVYDADALNLMAEASDPGQLAGILAAQSAIITPHPAEAARLLGSDAGSVQADRVVAACELAKQMRCVAVLKGSGTVVADAQGRWGIVAAGNPGLAQAGSGDLLAGIIAALSAQGLGAWDAACCGAWLHAAAADQAAAEQGGCHGVRLARVCELSSMMLAAAAEG